MMEFNFEPGLSGPDVMAIAARAAAAGLPAPGVPQSLFVDDKSRKPGPDWLERWGAAFKRSLHAQWDGGRVLSVDKDTIVKFMPGATSLSADRIPPFVADLPFELGSSRSLHPAWRDGSLGEDYVGPGFGDLHWSHGWACFFKGAGHDRLVSRRWLDFGPWRVLRGPGDLTMVQFHDLAADARTALEQARPGHERMGISRQGGFLQTNFVYAHELEGRYLPQRRTLDIVVNGREVTQGEMLDACAARHYQALGPDSPLDNVAYTFVREDEARAHLHELWLRGLECWAIVKGKETRLDLDYHPEPQPPDWVRALDARPAG